MNSGMLPLRGTLHFFKVLHYLLVYSIYDMPKKKKNTSYDIIWYDFINPA